MFLTYFSLFFCRIAMLKRFVKRHWAVKLNRMNQLPLNAVKPDSRIVWTMDVCKAMKSKQIFFSYWKWMKSQFFTVPINHQILLLLMKGQKEKQQDYSNVWFLINIYESCLLVIFAKVCQVSTTFKCLTFQFAYS